MEDVGVAHVAGRFLSQCRAARLCWPHEGRALLKETERCRALGPGRGASEDRGLSWAGRELPFAICWPDGGGIPAFGLPGCAMLAKELYLSEPECACWRKGGWEA